MLVIIFCLSTSLISENIACINKDMRQKVRWFCTFNCVIETKGLLKFTWYISETVVQHGDIVYYRSLTEGDRYITHRIAVNPMTLGDPLRSFAYCKPF